MAHLKASRGFYPAVALTDGAVSASPGSQAPRPRKSKGKGKSKKGRGKSTWQSKIGTIVKRTNCFNFFFLRYGRSRSKARSLHENKLLSRKLQHGHRWSHANWQIINTKTQNTTTKRQDADPPARFASHHPKDSKANSERGKSPTETTTK